MIYFDNSATTNMSECAVEVYKDYAVNNFYNPSGLYAKANNVANKLKDARQVFAKLLGIKSWDEVYFTASGTESDNMVIFGAKQIKNCRIIISAAEHSAVFNSAMVLKNNGVDVQLAPVDKFGKVIESEFIKLLTPNVTLVSVIHLNNETGAINNIGKLNALVKKISPKAVFHSDGVQAVGKIRINLSALDIDAYSFSAHKFHGAKGVGGLYIKKNVNIKPLIYGGGQEKGLRSATENVPGIMASATALEVGFDKFNPEELRKILYEIRNGIVKFEPNVIINSDLEMGAPHILSIALPNCRGEVLTHLLEDDGVIIGTGSACSARSATKRIPTALNLPKEYHMGMIRISLSCQNTLQEGYEFLEKLKTNYFKLTAIINGR